MSTVKTAVFRGKLSKMKVHLMDELRIKVSISLLPPHPNLVFYQFSNW